MPHRKSPIFIRIKASNNSIVCINPLQLASFHITEKAKVRVKDDTQPEGFRTIEADTVRFYTAQSTTFSYSVGVDITQNEFDYICATLIEYLYLNEIEFNAKAGAREKAKVEEWNKVMEEEEQELKAMTETPKAK